MNSAFSKILILVIITVLVGGGILTYFWQTWEEGEEEIVKTPEISWNQSPTGVVVEFTKTFRGVGMKTYKNPKIQIYGDGKVKTFWFTLGGEEQSAGSEGQLSESELRDMLNRFENLRFWNMKAKYIEGPMSYTGKTRTITVSLLEKEKTVEVVSADYPESFDELEQLIIGIDLSVTPLSYSHEKKTVLISSLLEAYRSETEPEIRIEIFGDGTGWYLEGKEKGSKSYSFSLTEEEIISLLEKISQNGFWKLRNFYGERIAGAKNDLYFLSVNTLPREKRIDVYGHENHPTEFDQLQTFIEETIVQNIETEKTAD